MMALFVFDKVFVFSSSDILLHGSDAAGSGLL
jgi:hypothetical protein